MQNELDAAFPELDIQLLGVNEVGSESGNASITSGRNIPWLQDVDIDGVWGSDVWTSWDVNYRDLIILDSDNTKLAVFNLTTHGLSTPENYNAVRQTLVDAAVVPEPASLTLLAIATISLLARAGRRRTS